LKKVFVFGILSAPMGLAACFSRELWRFGVLATAFYVEAEP
jgi:hypothetical protein